MKVLSCTTPGQLNYHETATPEAKDGQAIIKIKRIGICGTDLHAFEGTQPYFTYPRVLGHELAGELISDNIPGFTAGEAVTFIPYYNCGHCIACRMGKPNCCVHMQVCGVHVDGGMAEYLSVPASALVHGQGLSMDALALVEPLAIGAHGVRRAQIQPGEFVLVIGAGPIGLGAMEFAKLAGAKVIAMDLNETRLNFCKNKVHYTAQTIEEVKAITNGDMPTVVIDATGSQRAINNGFQYMAHGARYVLIGLQKQDIIFSHPEFHKREGTLMSSRNALREDFNTVISALKSGAVDPLTYITHRTPFDEVSNKFASWLDPTNGVIKAMVEL
jgi:2-desacetyl-2-hydroxyethyl bacteriochlorophyllide A dehydrogenase